MNDLEVTYTGDVDEGLVVSIGGLEVGTIERLGPTRRAQLNSYEFNDVLTDNEVIFLVTDEHSVERMTRYFGKDLPDLVVQIRRDALEIYERVEKFQASMI